MDSDKGRDEDGSGWDRGGEEEEADKDEMGWGYELEREKWLRLYPILSRTKEWEKDGWKVRI